MDKIVSEDDAILGTFKHLKLLRLLAEKKAGKTFKTSDYKWVLGVKIVRDFDMICSYQINRDAPLELLGITVEIDYHNTENIQLWENITNKL